MIKVFLVEDEIVVREGIKKNIDWEGHGYDFCGDERDGELAFPRIQKLKPDILITDIKMPFMDGIELSRLVKKELPDTEIILLTGYKDFSYAKEGIDIGVAQYLTKPVSGEDLLIEIDKIAEKIREKKQEKELRDKYMQEVEGKGSKNGINLFNSLVSGGVSAAEILEDAKNLEIDVSSIWYNILLFMAQRENKDLGSFSDTYNEFSDFVDRLCERLDIIVFDRDLEGMALLIKADTEEELVNKQEELVKSLEERLLQNDKLRYFGGFGKAVNRMTELPQCFSTAQQAFSHRFFVEDNRICYADLVTYSQPETEEFNIMSVDINHVDKSRVVDFIKTGNRDEVEYFVEELSKGAGTNFTQSLLFRQYIVMNVYFTVAGFIEEMGYSKEELGTVDFTTNLMGSPEEAIEAISAMLSKGIELRESVATSHYRQLVDEVIGYIREHFSDEDISLNSMASFANVSPNHLSMIFSQQTGVTFIKYLTDYRMNKARELLKCTSLRSSEIAEKVGYHDPHYFSYSFKKMYGITPTQYRGGND